MTSTRLTFGFALMAPLFLWHGVASADAGEAGMESSVMDSGADTSKGGMDTGTVTDTGGTSDGPVQVDTSPPPGGEDILELDGGTVNDSGGGSPAFDGGDDADSGAMDSSGGGSGCAVVHGPDEAALAVPSLLAVALAVALRKRRR